MCTIQPLTAPKPKKSSKTRQIGCGKTKHNLRKPHQPVRVLATQSIEKVKDLWIVSASNLSMLAHIPATITANIRQTLSNPIRIYFNRENLFASKSHIL